MKHEHPLTLSINIFDEDGNSISTQKTFSDETQWFPLMDQFLATLSAYGYVIKDLKIYIDQFGLVVDDMRVDSDSF